MFSSEIKRFIKFLIVGFINTLFGYSIYVSLIIFGFHFTIAPIFAIILGVIFNFFTTGGLVFQNIIYSKFHLFVGVYGFSYLLNISLLGILIQIGFTEIISGAIVLIPMAFINYIILKKIVYNI